MPGIVRLYACTPMYGNVSLCIHVHTFIKGVCCWRMFVYLLGIYSSRSHFVAIIRSLSLSFCLSYTICISRSASISVSICLYLSLSSSLCVFLCLSLCLSRLISLYLSLRGNFVYWWFYISLICSLCLYLSVCISLCLSLSLNVCLFLWGISAKS